jgi:hypothetical protein
MQQNCSFGYGYELKSAVVLVRKGQARENQALTLNKDSKWFRTGGVAGTDFCAVNVRLGERLSRVPLAPLWTMVRERWRGGWRNNEQR